MFAQEMHAALGQQIHAVVHELAVQRAVADQTELGMRGQPTQGLQQEAGLLFGRQPAHIAQQQRRGALAAVARMHMQRLAGW